MCRILVVLPLIISILTNCKQIEVPVNDASVYKEKHRPQFHFSPEANWMNDPNGMVYYDGEYHLFYQYYPDSTVWGPMHWSHAVSEDMVYWEHLPIALYPDELGYIFSGSAVIDHDNTSGLGNEGKPPMIAIFTHHDMEGERSGAVDYQYQSIAYSLDKGRTWTKYEGNPVVNNPGAKDFRDPKVIWHEETQRWVMVIAVYDKVQIYHSPDLIDWTFASEFGIPEDKRLWECPDLFPMKVKGTDEMKWVLIVSIQQQGPNGGTATSYFVGDFDGNTFTADNDNQKWMDYGTDNYALVTWSNVPEDDGRILAIGWMSNWQYAQSVPTEKWRSAMTLPRELILYKSGGDFHIRSLPVQELKSLEESTTEIKVSSDVVDLKGGLYKLDLTFTRKNSVDVQIRFENDHDEYLSIGFDGARGQYFIDRRNAGPSDFSEVFAAKHFGDVHYQSDRLQMTIYLDHSSIELFADDGRCVMTDIFFPTVPFDKMRVVSGRDLFQIGSISELKSIW